MQLLEPGEANGREGWLESWSGLLQRRWRPALSVFLALAAFCVFTIFRAIPVYRANARLRLGEPPPASGVSPTASVFGLMRLGGDPFANDLELLDSRTLTEQVIRDQSLNAKLIEPRGWTRDSVFTSFRADSTTTKATFELAWQDDGRVAVRQVAPRDSAIATVAAGQPVQFGGVTVMLRARRPEWPRKIRVRTIPPAMAVLEQRPKLAVERSRRDANVVDLAYDGNDAAVVRGVVNSMIGRFIELRAEIARRESEEAVDSLRVVVDSTNRELASAESALESWQRNTHLVQPDVQGEAFVERYSGLVTQVEQTNYELDAIAAIADRMDATPDSGLDWSVLLTLPKFLENQTVGQLLTRFTELRGQRSELLMRRAETSHEVRLVDEQIQALDSTLRSLVHGYRTALARGLDVLKGQVASMDTALSHTPSQTIEMGRRQRAIRLLSEIILMTEERLRQEQMRQALTFSNVQVIDPPAIRFKPIWPRKKLGLAVGLLDQRHLRPARALRCGTRRSHGAPRGRDRGHYRCAHSCRHRCGEGCAARAVRRGSKRCGALRGPERH